MADKLIEHTEELVEGKLVPSVEKDPFTLALGKPYHPGRVVGAGGSLLGWEKVMGPEYTKSGRSRASVNSPHDLVSTVESIKEQVRNELVSEFNAWAKQMNLPSLPFPSNTPVDSCSHPKGQGEDDIHGDNDANEGGTPTHADSRELDNPTPHHFPDLQEETRCALLHPDESRALHVVAYGSAQPAEQGTVHLRPLRPQHCSVGINSVTTGFEDILIPVPIEEEEFTTLWAAKDFAKKTTFKEEGGTTNKR
ncbi:uncharacterized protein LOC110709489 [Chenopodium quinoa]|uniref:uncharacterized protein LOC110709489 n=1 Tax=Chenopodium quinoa TaxID=63459 RepID=UPI000B797057|nr:uncharacterized protein LOC110709489 [Chenopodium quinoa]